MKENKFNIVLLFLALLSVGCSSTQTRRELAHDSKERLGISKAHIPKQLSIDELEAMSESMSVEKISKNIEGVQFLLDDLFIKATDSSMRGDSKTAARLYSFIVKLRPNDFYLKRKFVVELIRNGKIAESLPVLKALFKHDSKDEAIGLLLGGVHTALDNGNAAKLVYKKVLVSNPKSEEACIFLAKGYAAKKHYKSLRNHLGRCQKSSPDNALFPYYLGKVELEKKNIKKAVSLFKKALKLDKNFYQAAISLGEYYELKENFKAAQVIYEKFLKSNEYNRPVLSRYVQLLFSQSKLGSIIPYLERLSATDPSDLNLKVRLGILYSDRKRFTEAKGVFKEILTQVPTSDKVLYYLGTIYQQTGELDESIDYFSRIESESPLYKDGHIQIAQIFQTLALKDISNVEKLEEFVSTSSKKIKDISVDLHILLAGFYETKQDYSKAVEAAELVQANEKFKDNHNYFLASLYEKNDEFSKARDLVEKMIKTNPNNAHALNFLGYSLLDRGIEMDKALEYISSAVKLRPEDGYIRDSLGWYYYKVGDFKKALYHLKKAQKLVSNDHVINKHLGMVYQRLNQSNQAIKFYAEAVKYCQKIEDKEDLLKSIQSLKSGRLPASKK